MRVPCRCTSSRLQQVEPRLTGCLRVSRARGRHTPAACRGRAPWQDAGLRVVRTWGFNHNLPGFDSNGQMFWSEQEFEGLDYIVQQVRTRSRVVRGGQMALLRGCAKTMGGR